MKNKRTPTPVPNQPEKATPATLDRVIQLAEAGQLDAALKHLGSVSSLQPDLYNARGVCLLRLGRIKEALQLFRSLVLQSGGVWMKAGLPVIYRTNFVTALILSGLLPGASFSLNEIEDQNHPAVSQLKDVFARWEKKLSWWQWLNWKTGVCPEVPLSLDFLPGEFRGPLATPPAAQENPSSVSSVTQPV